MNIWFSAIARAGGIEVAPGTTPGQADRPKTRRDRAIPRLVRRVLADVRGGTPLYRLETRALRWLDALRIWHKRRKAIRELNGLSNHSLKDIGLHRSEIPSVVEDMLRSATATRERAPVTRQPVRRLPMAATFLGTRPCEEPC